MTNLNSGFVLIIASLALSGCATQVKKADFGTIVESQGIFISTKKIVNVGEVMLHDREYSKDKTRLQIQTFGIAENSVVSVQHKKHTFTFSIPSGDYLLHSKNSEGSFYASVQPFAGLKNTRNGYGGVFVPNGSSEATEFYWSWVPNVPSAHQAKLLTPIHGSMGKTISSLSESLSKTVSSSNYKSDYILAMPRETLTYAGVAGGQIRFVYKEFTKEGLARPAFTQEVNLDYKAGGTYTYKSASFKVYSADSTHINFEVITPL